MKASPELLEELIWELRRAFRELMVAADRELESVGIQAGDRAFLEFLARESKPVSLSDLARKYSVSRQHIHQTLRRLPDSEWVEEIPDPTDSRSVLLSLSRKGRAHWRKIRDIDHAFLRKLAGRLSHDRVEAATSLLRQLRKEVANEPQ